MRRLRARAGTTQSVAAAWAGALAAFVFGVPIARAEESGLTLERAIRLARERSESALAAGELARAADARLDRARAMYFPDLTLSGTYTRRAFGTTRDVGGETITIQDQNALAGTATLGLTLFDARSFPLNRQARLDRDAARLREEDAARLAAFDAALAFLDVLGAEQVVAAAERRVALAQTSLADARARLAAGLVGSNDVTRATLELAAAERDLARAHGDVEVTRLALGHLVGTPVTGRLVPPEVLLAEAGSPPQEPERLVERGRARLDVRAAEKSAEALHASSSEPGLRAVPTLALLGTTRTTNEAGFSGRHVDGSVAVTLTWLLWDGGERSAEGDERTALANAGELDAQGLERLADLEVRSAASALRIGQASLLQAEATVAAAEQNSRETGELYRSGLAPALAIADAGLQLFEAEVDLVRARYGLAQSLLDLRRAAGLDPLLARTP